MKKIISVLFSVFCLSFNAASIDHPQAVLPVLSQERFTLVDEGKPISILIAPDEDKAILRAASDLCQDFCRVTGVEPYLGAEVVADRMIIIGSARSSLIRQIAASGQIDLDELDGCNEKYMIKTVIDPIDGVREALVITGSDRRGVVYGVYEISEQIGVSPW